MHFVEVLIGCWLSPALMLLLMVTATDAGLRCDCSKNGRTYSELSITCERDKKAGGKVLCTNEKHGPPLEDYDVFKSDISDKYRSLFRLYRTGRDWEGASAACQRDGGHLAAFEEQEKVMYLASVIEKQGNNRTTGAALGLRKSNGSTDYQTVTGKRLGSLVTYYWGAGQSYDAPDRQCMMLNLNPSGGFYLGNHDCEEPTPYICERTLSSPVLTSYKLVSGLGFYLLSTTFLPYAKAEIECVKNGGHIVVPNTQKEADSLMRVFDDFPGLDQMYVGIDDRSGTGDFTTVHGERMSLLEFQNWSPGALDSRTAEERCVAITSLGYYQLVDCSLPLPTVCEWPLY